MSLTPKFELRQSAKLSQQLSLTPQLLQAIKLLQMSQAELLGFIESEIEKNPLLEREDGNDTIDSQAAPSSSGDRTEGDWLDPSQDAGDIAATLDTDIENVFPEDDGSASPSSENWQESYSPYWQERSQSGENSYDDASTSELSLAESLTRQFYLATGDLRQRFIAQQLIELVEDSGYITAPLENVAERLSVPLREVESTLEILQGCDPAGICARDLQECLALQLKEKNHFDPAMEKLIAHLDLVAKGDLVSLKRICEVDAEDIAEMIAELRQLNPKPGLAFTSSFSETLLPDVVVRKTSKGEWLIELNADVLPRLLVNETYATRFNTAAKTPTEKQYVSTCLQTANWLVKALDQRAKTVLKVATEIVKKQQAFFERGVAGLKPMYLRDIAEAIEMHESTVSRVTANKFMATPRGIFEFRYFFSTALAANDGEAISSESVRHRIKVLIEGENQANILSDDSLVDILKKEGVVIARRTVAKYRDMMNIPTSAERKRQKRKLG